MHLCKNCVHRGFLSCLKVKGSCKVGGEVCLTILFNLFGENRKGAGRAHIWSSLWLLLWKQLISFVFFFYYWKKWKQISEEKRARPPVARTLGEILLESPAVLKHRERLALGRAPACCSWGWSPSGVREVPLGASRGPLELSYSCCCWGGEEMKLYRGKGRKAESLKGWKHRVSLSSR